jgi:hypothetical protein
MSECRQTGAVVTPHDGGMTSMAGGYRIHAIAPDAVDKVRVNGSDVSGNPVEHVVARGGEPLRCCLRDAVADEELLLFGYEPALPASPYREIGAVFAHAAPCGGPPSDRNYPPDWLGRPQVLRAYDRRGWIHPATQVHDGSDPEAVIAAILADSTVAQVHSRNIAYGCYMFSVVRTDTVP